LEIELKRILKLGISLCFFSISALWAAARRIFGFKQPGRCIVLYYHVVRPGDRSTFAWQMDELLRRAQPLPADYMLALMQETRYAVVTFDDGYVCAIENAVPELVKRKIPVTIFIATAALGTRPDWREYGAADGTDLIISADELKALQDDLIMIGSQTISHRMLEKLSDDEAMQELRGSREQLFKLLNRDITLFSFPYGSFDERLVELCREAGYERVFTTWPVLAFGQPNEFETGRVRVDPTDWRIEFRLKLLGAYSWLPKAFVLKRRIQSLFGPNSGAKSLVTPKLPVP
jgi:peptidoglycan/xylan/chitin deacetylase (PgdA/CDA1 family)